MNRFSILDNKFVLPAIVIFAIIVIWQVIWSISPLLPVFVVPAPSSVLVYLFNSFWFLYPNVLTTLFESLAGFALGAIVGIALALAITYSKWLSNILYPLIIMSQVVPKIAIAPLIVLVLGFGLANKIVVAFLITFFPIVIATALGFSSVPPEILDLARTTGAHKWRTFTKVQFPSSLPYIFSGFKVGITFALVGAIAAEWIQANSGLGYLLLSAAGDLDANLMFADLLLLTILGAALFVAVSVIENRLVPWKSQANEEARVSTSTI